MGYNVYRKCKTISVPFSGEKHEDYVEEHLLGKICFILFDEIFRVPLTNFFLRTYQYEHMVRTYDKLYIRISELSHFLFKFIYRLWRFNSYINVIKNIWNCIGTNKIVSCIILLFNVSEILMLCVFKLTWSFPKWSTEDLLCSSFTSY